MGDTVCTRCSATYSIATFHWCPSMEPQPYVMYTEEVVKKPMVTRKHVSVTHLSMRIDGKDFVCDDCGSVSGDFDLFEEVGAEVVCKVVEVMAEEKKRILYPSRATTKTEMSTDINDLYKKLLGEVTAAEAAGTARRVTRIQDSIVWEPTPRENSFKDLAAELRDYNRKPENQKRYYDGVYRSLKRKMNGEING